MSSSFWATAPATEPHRGKRNPNRKQDQAPRPLEVPAKPHESWIDGAGGGGGGRDPNAG